MKKLLKNERGASHLVAVLVVLVVAIVGVIGLRVSNAYVWPSYRQKPSFSIPSRSTNPGSYTNTGATATCSANGNPGITVNGVCRASSPGTPGVSNNTTTTTTGAPGISGSHSSTCTINGQVIPC